MNERIRLSRLLSTVSFLHYICIIMIITYLYFIFPELDAHDKHGRGRKSIFDLNALHVIISSFLHIETVHMNVFDFLLKWYSDSDLCFFRDSLLPPSPPPLSLSSFLVFGDTGRFQLRRENRWRVCPLVIALTLEFVSSTMIIW